MGEEAAPPPAPAPAPAPVKMWRERVAESADSAILSAQSLRQSSSTLLQSFQELVPQIGSGYRYYEGEFFNKLKDGLVILKQNPAVGGGVALAGILLMRGPRRFLLRQTLHRLQSEESRFVRAEKNVQGLNLSVDMMKKESIKLLERSVLAEKDMKHGYQNVKNAGTQIRSQLKSIYKTEAEAANLMSLLRNTPGREAIRLRAEVASMTSQLRQQRLAMDKRLLKISELGVPV